MTYTTVTGVEIFRPGRWHGRNYGPDDIKRMVANSNRMRPYFRAPLKLTHHAEQPGLLQEAAMGMTARYYLKRDASGQPIACADITNVPSPLAETIRNHFPNVSVEKYRYLEQDGTRYPDVIRSIAFLGAEPPAVKGLKNAYPGVFQELRHGGIECFQMRGKIMIGETITKKREELGMTPEDLAGVLNVEPEVIAQWEAGDVEPEESQLQALADALGVSLEELKGEKAEDGGDKSAAKPEKKEEPAMFSEGDVSRMVEIALARQAKAMNARIDALARKYQKTEAELFQERQAAKKEHIQTKILEWRKAGMPAVMERMGLETFMEKLDNGHALELFDDNGKPAPEKPLEWFERWVEKFQELGLVDSRELSGEDYDPTLRDDPNGQVEHYAEQHHLTYADAARELSRQGKLTV